MPAALHLRRARHSRTGLTIYLRECWLYPTHSITLEGGFGEVFSYNLLKNCRECLRHQGCALACILRLYEDRSGTRRTFCNRRVYLLRLVSCEAPPKISRLFRLYYTLFYAYATQKVYEGQSRKVTLSIWGVFIAYKTITINFKHTKRILCASSDTYRIPYILCTFQYFISLNLMVSQVCLHYNHNQYNEDNI